MRRNEVISQSLRRGWVGLDRIGIGDEKKKEYIRLPLELVEKVTYLWKQTIDMGKVGM